MKQNKVRISQSEWEIMEVLWQRSPLSAGEIFSELEHMTTWNNKTVRSFLDRLQQKNAVLKKKAHGINVFEPAIERDKCLRMESTSFLSRFFKGNPVSMMTHFIEREELSDDDIKRLQKLLKSKKNNNER